MTEYFVHYGLNVNVQSVSSMFCTVVYYMSHTVGLYDATVVCFQLLENIIVFAVIYTDTLKSCPVAGSFLLTCL